MKILKLKRTFKEGFSNFIRNGWLSVATITVLSISLFIIGITFSLGITANSVLKNIQNKVSVSVYFNPDVPEERILAIKKEAEGKYLEIKSIEYVSKDQAKKDLLDYKPSLQKAFDAVGDNPLLPSLVVKANNLSQYDLIASAFQESFKKEISNVQKNEVETEKIKKVMGTAEKAGIVLGILYILIAILITFNTVRITIYSHKQEFEIMRLVGASNIYVEMPFLFEGILYGIFAAIVSTILLLLSSWYFYSLDRNFFSETGLNFATIGIIFLVLVLSGIILGVISSSIAIRRYLKK